LNLESMLMHFVVRGLVGLKLWLNGMEFVGGLKKVDDYFGFPWRLFIYFSFFLDI